MSHILSIDKETEDNSHFRKVVFTGAMTQLVVMNIPVGGEIGEETHAHVEQALFIRSGSARVMFDGVEQSAVAGDVVMVTPGTRHNIINAGLEPLTICTLYAPPNHIDGRIHKTKAEADADTEDEAFGKAVL